MSFSAETITQWSDKFGAKVTVKPGKATKKSTFSSSKDERKASQGYVDIKNKTVEELDELIERQNKLLQNRSFLEKLPDKGKKILSFKTQLEIERSQRQAESEAACQLLFNLSLNDKNVNEIEWDQEKSAIHKKQHDSDEENGKEDTDLLKIVATHSGTANGIRVSSSKELLYIDKFCEKYGKANNCKERFKPNQFRDNNKSIIKSSAEKVKKILGSKWEVTEATPPVPVYSDAVMISLSESLKLQKEQAQLLEELNKKHAVEKLLQNMSIKMGDRLPQNNVTQYRSNNCFLDTNTDDDDEEEDDVDADDAG